MLNVVLVEPEIPANTGNIGRTCVLVGARLHLVGPMGFDLSHKAVQRAGLAYWESPDLHTYRTWDAFVEEALPNGIDASTHLFTKAGAHVYSETTYGPDDWLVFGKESAGLSDELLRTYPTRTVRIPMRDASSLVNQDGWHSKHAQLHPELRQDICGNYVDERVGQITSLNLSNAVAIAVFEALRQQDFAGLETR